MNNKKERKAPKYAYTTENEYGILYEKTELEKMLANINKIVSNNPLFSVVYFFEIKKKISVNEKQIIFASIRSKFIFVEDL